MSRRWVPLVDRSSVGPGRIVAVDDHEVVVWRSAGGDWCVMDSRCPHQWSHLEAEGVVDGEELVCTSHFWRFGLDGRGSKLSMTGRRDLKADVEVHPSREVDGRIFALLDDDRAAAPS